MTPNCLRRWGGPSLITVLLIWMLAGTANAQFSTIEDPPKPQGAQDGAVQLRPSDAPRTNESTSTDVVTVRPRQPVEKPDEKDAYVAGEFERFVQRIVGPVGPNAPKIRRFGAEVIAGAIDRRSADMGSGVPFEGRSPDLSPLVPRDYVVAPGDEILVTLWGSVVADLRLLVDRSGRISVPRVGSIQVAGVRNADLPAVVEHRVAQVFKNFQLSVSMGQLRGIRVLVTGFAMKPGTYSMSALSTVVSALMQAGGPSSAGSFRQVDLRRGSTLVGRFDLYDLLLRGDRSADHLVQAGDVVHVGPVGPQVALIGSVNHPAVFEIKPGEKVADLIAMAGGFSAVADRSRLSLERLDDRSNLRIRQLGLPGEGAMALANGDVLRAFSAVDANQPVERQNKRVVIEGEVLRPGEYVLPPASSIADAIQAAGGLTSAAFIFGTEFTRESVRKNQLANYERALRDLETEFTRATATRRTSNTEEAAAQAASSAATARLLASLRAVRPTGRVVLQLPPESRELPDLALEDGDRIHVPPRATTVGVFGSVFNGGSYLFTGGRDIDQYLRLAGGPTTGADERSMFVIRANGSVVSARQSTGWFNNNGLAGLAAEPGDTIFVPEEMDKTTWMQHAKDWTQLLAQFALGVAAIQVLGN